MKKLAFLVAVAASLLAVDRARAQTVIDHLPYTITAKGQYVLTADLDSAQTEGVLIEVAANNVTIDLQGHYISGPVNNTAQTVTGIYALERNNITVKNGTIANVFNGVFFSVKGSSSVNNLNHEFDDLRITRCLFTGIYLGFAKSSVINNCKVSQIGTGNGDANGIAMSSNSVLVQNCSVSQGTGNSTGINLSGGGLARANTVTGFKYGVTFGKYENNLTANCGTPFSSGIDAGGNN